MKYHIEITPFDRGCHWAVVGSSGFFWSGGCRGSVLEAVASAFGSARTMSRAKSFRVAVVA